jgi:hypothetical protein
MRSCDFIWHSDGNENYSYDSDSDRESTEDVAFVRTQKQPCQDTGLRVCENREIRRIIRKRVDKGVTYYLTKWCSTWESKYALGNAHDLVKEFEAQLRAKHEDRNRRGGARRRKREAGRRASRPLHISFIDNWIHELPSFDANLLIEDSPFPNHQRLQDLLIHIFTLFIAPSIPTQPLTSIRITSVLANAAWADVDLFSLSSRMVFNFHIRPSNLVNFISTIQLHRWTRDLHRLKMSYL